MPSVHGPMTGAATGAAGAGGNAPANTALLAIKLIAVTANFC